MKSKVVPVRIPSPAFSFLIKKFFFPTIKPRMKSELLFSIKILPSMRKVETVKENTLRQKTGVYLPGEGYVHFFLIWRFLFDAICRRLDSVTALSLWVLDCWRIRVQIAVGRLYWGEKRKRSRWAFPRAGDTLFLCIFISCDSKKLSNKMVKGFAV